MGKSQRMLGSGVRVEEQKTDAGKKKGGRGASWDSSVDLSDCESAARAHTHTHLSDYKSGEHGHEVEMQHSFLKRPPIRRLLKLGLQSS